jgi:hypothetical protein
VIRRMSNPSNSRTFTRAPYRCQPNSQSRKPPTHPVGGKEIRDEPGGVPGIGRGGCGGRARHAGQYR